MCKRHSPRSPGSPANSGRRPPHPEFAPAADAYAYPQHLREAIEQAPQAPGIYVFHGAEGGLPLYIGKSVNLRSRLLSHLRNAEEARMLRQTQRISFERTAGEIGALLLEARLIKQLQPLYNQKLRRNRQLCAWQMPDAGSGASAPVLVYSRDLDFAHTPRLFGLYSSRTTAVAALQALADEHQLCYGRLGLEKLAPGRGCFRAMLQHCAGVCCGRESAQAHDARLADALEAIRVMCWPFAGAVGLVERWEDEVQVHAVNQWCYLGSAGSVEAARALHQQAPGFDADGYKILCKPLLGSALEIVPL
jgi:excinuclease Cho